MMGRTLKIWAGGARRQGFLSVAAYALALALLFLLSSMSNYSISLSETGAALSRLEVTGAGFDAASFGMAQILRRETVSPAYSGFNLSLFLRLPFTANYTQDVGRWQAFAQAYGAPASVSINTSEAARPVLYVRPQNITIEYQAGRVLITPQNATFSQGQVLGYDDLMRISQPVGRLNWTQKSNVSPADPSALYFHIAVQGTNGTVSDTQYLNRSALSEVRLLDALDRSVMTVQVNPEAALRVYYDTSIGGNLTTVLGLNSSSTLELGTNVINAAYEARKAGPVKIAG
ncbi:MAG: hypothetical protein M1530_00440 [Candidatus Marsarchaeota archaeon]|nr:hypothetical protein [Candidatus Marsarchaeota archaeon]